MKQKLKFTDIVAVGFMLFAFFLGAGNIIFPPLAGQEAGVNLYPAMIGFLLTAVGLPLITIIAIAVAGGTWEHLTNELPKKAATLIAVLIFIIIGPAFAAPRTGLVAYEMTAKPFIADASQLHLIIFSVVFFAIAMFFSWSQGKLIDLIGKILTPVLFIALIVLALGVMFEPQGAIEAARNEYISQPLSKGFLEGYNTMDTFGSLMFGMLIIDALRKKGITDSKVATKYLVITGFIAAAGLAFVYVSLFFLGATSSSVAPNADGGAIILTQYVSAMFGPYGQLVLSVIVLLACLTTAIGLISACSDYFSSMTKISYQSWVLINGIACAIVANIGLTQLIELSVPVLFALYPVAIMLVVLTFTKSWFKNPQALYRVVVSVALFFALIDGAKAAGLNTSALDFLPLYNIGMAWVLPSFAAMIVMFFVKGQSSPATSNSIA